MKYHRTTAWGRALLLVAACTGLHCNEEDYARLYKTHELAPGFSRTAVESLEHLGPTVVEAGVNFGVYSERATRVEVLFFDDPESNVPSRQFPMHRFGDVWNIYVEGIGLGTHYGYIAWGPNWEYHPDWKPGTIHGFVADVDEEGNRFNPNKLLLDPYALAIHRDHDWLRASPASGPKRTEVTYGAAMKGIVIASQYEWSEQEKQWRKQRQEGKPHDWTDVVVYEVHPKGFTAEAASGVIHPGTYRGFGEKAAYLAELGITAVELMPVHEKPQDGGYWGYWNISFFALENTYAATPRGDLIVDEFKWMVDQLHQHGIEVLIDVVYNHTGEGGLWRERRFIDSITLDSFNEVSFAPKEVATIQSFRGLDNAAYYALSEDKQTYWNNTGVGNQTRCNHRPMRRLILDSLRYMVEELHVDGFRFDLAGILGEQDLNYNTWDDPANTVLQDIIDDPVLQKYNTRIIAEPWTSGGHHGTLIGAYPVASTRPDFAWLEWNGYYRDWWRSFVNDDGWVLNRDEGNIDGGAAILGSPSKFGWNNRKPFHSVNFITAHDGFTLYDLFSYNEKVNGCGPLNPICCESEANPWCDLDSGKNHNRSRDWGQHAEDFKRQLMRNMFVAMLISHGTPMILGGDEWMRTQWGNNNPYSSAADNEWNWFRWGEWQASNERHRMFDFVRQMIRLRREKKAALSVAEYGQAPFAWKNLYNHDMQDGDWGGKRLMMHFYNPEATPELAILINMDRDDADFSLPEGRDWHRLVDTQIWFDTKDYLDAEDKNHKLSANISLDTPVAVPGYVYGVKGSSIVILEAL